MSGEYLALLAGVFVVVTVLASGLYVFWRRNLYVAYIDYDNNYRIPHVPEAWRKNPAASRIDLMLEFEMLRCPVRADMNDALKRMMIWQKRIFWGLYVPCIVLACASILWQVVFHN